MNALMVGGLIILYLLLSNTVGAYIQTQTTPDNPLPSCTVDQNLTACNSASQTSFVAAVLDVSVSGLNGAPVWFNAIWILVNATLLTLAVIDIVSFFIGLIFGGAA